MQIMKKSVKLPMLVHYLVKECGLIPWLSTVLLFYGEELGGDHKESSLKAMELVLKVNLLLCGQSILMKLNWQTIF